MDFPLLADPAAFTAGLVIAAIAVGVIGSIFWLWMLVDAIGNAGLDGTEKIVWVLVILFLHFVGALLYLFLARSNARGGPAV